MVEFFKIVVMGERARDRDILASKYIENALVGTSVDGDLCPRTVHSPGPQAYIGLFT
jgi:hypothetical protein